VSEAGKRWSAGGRGRADRILRDGQALGEQGEDVAPGSLCVQRVMADAGDRGVVDRWVAEGVEGSSVDHEAPVDARGLHLLGERDMLCGWHDRVL
jgi:hypothetical protein